MVQTNKPIYKGRVSEFFLVNLDQKLSEMNLSVSYLTEIQQTTTQADHFIIFLKQWEGIYGNYTKGYVLPIGVLLTVINNLIIFLVVSFGPNVRKRVSPQMRIYYGAIAIADTSTSFPLHATYFAGKLHYYWLGIDLGSEQ